jgi:hypothetical protein
MGLLGIDIKISNKQGPWCSVRCDGLKQEKVFN